MSEDVGIETLPAMYIFLVVIRVEPLHDLRANAGQKFHLPQVHLDCFYHTILPF